MEGVWVHDEAHVLSVAAKANCEAILKSERDSTFKTRLPYSSCLPWMENRLEEFSLSRPLKNGSWVQTRYRQRRPLFWISIGDRKV